MDTQLKSLNSGNMNVGILNETWTDQPEAAHSPSAMVVLIQGRKPCTLA